MPSDGDGASATLAKCKRRNVAGHASVSVIRSWEPAGGSSGAELLEGKVTREVRDAGAIAVFPGVWLASWWIGACGVMRLLGRRIVGQRRNNREDKTVGQVRRGSSNEIPP